MKILINSSVASLLLLSTGSTLLAACAHAQSAGAIENSSAKEASGMTSTESYKPQLASDYPEITPEEMGRRFLKLVDGLKTIDDLTVERIIDQAKLPMKYAPLGMVYSFTIPEPMSGWYYGLDFYQDPGSGRKTARVEFANPRDSEADKGPVCGMDFDGYVSALKRMGFRMSPSYDSHGNLLEYHFYRGKINVMLLHGEQAREPEEKRRHFCVESISVHGAR